MRSRRWPKRDAISGLGIDQVGVLVGDGRVCPRELSAQMAAPVLAAIRAPAKPVVLVLSADIDLIETIARHLKPAILHLGASTESIQPQHLIDLRRALPNMLLMRSVPVTGPDSVAVATSCDGLVDFLLLDSHREGDVQIGALGVTHDWSISRRVVDRFELPSFWPAGLVPTISPTPSARCGRPGSIPRPGPIAATPTRRTSQRSPRLSRPQRARR